MRMLTLTLTQIGLPEPAGGPALTGADPARTAAALGRADIEHQGYLAAAGRGGVHRSRSPAPAGT
jgi:hypothetical protein